MDFSFGTLELTRLNNAHLGTSPLQDISSPLGKTNSAEQKKTKASSFQNYLMEAVESMNAQQNNVSKIQEQLITDPDSVDIHDVTISMAKAQMSLNLAQTVIERLVSGWTELSQNR